MKPLPLTMSDLQLCIETLSDANSYTLGNRFFVDRTIDYLFRYFSPDVIESSQFSLAIKDGKNGSCLTHSHAQQFKFVHQTLQLWKEIQNQMMKLWICADYDILNTNYQLCNTGQGVNRMQQANAVSTVMHKILNEVKSKVGWWEGLSVVHLGDRDVPNALVFIDKYSQIPRILGPIVQTLDNVDICANGDQAIFLKHFGDAEKTKKTILTDFFKHGFDGSGDDGGSCIDGRLTSCWNWCSQIHKKSYYPIFLLSGFHGFDGSFKK